MWRWEAEGHLPTGPADDSRAGSGRPRHDAVWFTPSGNAQRSTNTAAVIRAGRISIRSMLSLLVLLVCLSNHGAGLAKISHFNNTLNLTLNHHGKTLDFVRTTGDYTKLSQKSYHKIKSLEPSSQLEKNKSLTQTDRKNSNSAAPQITKSATAPSTIQTSPTSLLSQHRECRGCRRTNIDTTTLRTRSEREMNRNRFDYLDSHADVDMEREGRRDRDPTPGDATRRFPKRQKHLSSNRKATTVQKNRLQQIKDFKPLPKIIRDHNNYSMAILKAEKNDKGQLKEPIDIISQYAANSTFLHRVDWNNVEANHKGDVTIKCLKPGNNFLTAPKRIHPATMKLQVNTNSCTRLQNPSEKETMSMRILPPKETGIAKSPSLECLNTSSSARHSWRSYQARKMPLKRSLSKQQTQSRSHITQQQRLNLCAIAVRLLFLESHKRWYGQHGGKMPTSASVKYAKILIVTMQTVTKYDAADAESHMKLANVHNPMMHRNIVWQLSL